MKERIWNRAFQRYSDMLNVYRYQILLSDMHPRHMTSTFKIRHARQNASIVRPAASFINT